MKGLKTLLIFTIFAIITVQGQSNRPPCKGVPDGTFVQDPSSCEGWLQCFNEEGKSGRCRDGYIFDRRTGSCNYKDKVDCRTRNPCKGKSDGSFVDNPASCASYFVCIGEDPKSGSCPGDLYFNPNKQQCVQPREYECDPAGPAKADIACQGLPDYSFVENEDTCGEYFVCVAEHGRPGRCPNNYLYNAKKGICDFKAAIDCPEPTTTPTPEINICFGVENGKFLKDPTSCPAYIQCIDGEPVNGACENGLWFNPDNGICDFPENVQCTPNPCEGKQNGEFMPDPEICGAFLQCVDGTSKPGRCPEGLLFNPINGYCDYAENVDCGNQITTTTTTTELPTSPPPVPETTTSTQQPPPPMPETPTSEIPPPPPKGSQPLFWRPESVLNDELDDGDYDI